ncbi:hypothetical protein [Ruegeria denitrificans]|nr:hypothetical protein [Ruegeria denitrificans]
MHVTLSLASDAQVIGGFMPAMGDVTEIGSNISADSFAIFEESGDALGQTSTCTEIEQVQRTI